MKSKSRKALRKIRKIVSLMDKGYTISIVYLSEELGISKTHCGTLIGFHKEELGLTRFYRRDSVWYEKQ